MTRPIKLGYGNLIERSAPTVRSAAPLARRAFGGTVPSFPPETSITNARTSDFGALVGAPFPIIDEAHGERLAGHAVSKRLREGQGGAALERLRHGRVIRRALHV